MKLVAQVTTTAAAVGLAWTAWLWIAVRDIPVLIHRPSTGAASDTFAVAVVGIVLWFVTRFLLMYVEIATIDSAYYSGLVHQVIRAAFVVLFIACAVSAIGLTERIVAATVAWTAHPVNTSLVSTLIIAAVAFVRSQPAGLSKSLVMVCAVPLVAAVAASAVGIHPSPDSAAAWTVAIAGTTWVAAIALALCEAAHPASTQRSVSAVEA